MNKALKRLLYKLGFQVLLKDDQFFTFQHRDSPDILLYMYPLYQQAMFIFEDNYEDPLYHDSYLNDEFAPLLKESLNQILD